MRFSSLLAACLFLYGCASAPEWYPPPLESSYRESAEQAPASTVISMEDPLVDAYIVSGILPNDPGSRWRWAGQRVELRFTLTDISNLKFFMDFAIDGSTFEKTGPVNLQFFVDGKPFAKAHCSKPGEQHFETPVDAALLKVEEGMVVAVESDKVFTSPLDGVKLAFMLVRAGFQR
jgi:hypothetical protein